MNFLEVEKDNFCNFLLDIIYIFNAYNLLLAAC